MRSASEGGHLGDPPRKQQPSEGVIFDAKVDDVRHLVANLLSKSHRVRNVMFLDNQMLRMLLRDGRVVDITVHVKL